jgi:hypothetical protein
MLEHLCVFAASASASQRKVLEELGMQGLLVAAFWAVGLLLVFY